MCCLHAYWNKFSCCVVLDAYHIHRGVSGRITPFAGCPKPRSPDSKLPSRNLRHPLRGKRLTRLICVRAPRALHVPRSRVEAYPPAVADSRPCLFLVVPGPTVEHVRPRNLGRREGLINHTGLRRPLAPRPFKSYFLRTPAQDHEVHQGSATGQLIMGPIAVAHHQRTPPLRTGAQHSIGH